MRREFITSSIIIILLNLFISFIYPPILWSMILFGPLILVGMYDYFQDRQTIKRNFPIIGRFRYLFEAIRPEINQYFVESNTDGKPFSRNERSLVYQRAKKNIDTLPFGTEMDLYQPGYEWVNHSMNPVHANYEDMFVMVGGPDCTQKYKSSLLNISAMSYGSLSKNAILALNGGAKDGHFAHNTGEGGISDYHLKNGGDLIWQIGTGYFGCRNAEGVFCETSFSEKASLPNVKMIEIKISQGAKPGHGGILPKEKVNEEISKIRGVPMGIDIISPPSHTAFKTPFELIAFISKLRKLSGGKPVGFKLCIGKRREFIAICKAMVDKNCYPDFITVDGGEGGTGAAPKEFSDHIGTPGVDAQIFVHNTLVGFGIRKHIKIIVTGKITTGFDIVKRIALGADLCYAARSMMMALGCIQARVCNTNHCPVGVATQKPEYVHGLIVNNKRFRVKSYHHETIDSLAHILGTMGFYQSYELRPWHVIRRVENSIIKNYSELYEYIKPNSLLKDDVPKSFERALATADPNTFKQNLTTY